MRSPVLLHPRKRSSKISSADAPVRTPVLRRSRRSRFFAPAEELSGAAVEESCSAPRCDSSSSSGLASSSDDSDSEESDCPNTTRVKGPPPSACLFCMGCSKHEKEDALDICVRAVIRGTYPEHTYRNRIGIFTEEEWNTFTATVQQSPEYADHQRLIAQGPKRAAILESKAYAQKLCLRAVARGYPAPPRYVLVSAGISNWPEFESLNKQSLEVPADEASDDDCAVLSSVIVEPKPAFVHYDLRDFVLFNGSDLFPFPEDYDPDQEDTEQQSSEPEADDDTGDIDMMDFDDDGSACLPQLTPRSAYPLDDLTEESSTPRPAFLNLAPEMFALDDTDEQYPEIRVSPPSLNAMYLDDPDSPIIRYSIAPPPSPETELRTLDSIAFGQAEMLPSQNSTEEFLSHIMRPSQ